MLERGKEGKRRSDQEAACLFSGLASGFSGDACRLSFWFAGKRHGGKWGKMVFDDG
jgi:hypothetical protein